MSKLIVASVAALALVGVTAESNKAQAQFFNGSLQLSIGRGYIGGAYYSNPTYGYTYPGYYTPGCGYGAYSTYPGVYSGYGSYYATPYYRSPYYGGWNYGGGYYHPHHHHHHH
jgi:hypothetical protein